MIHINEDAFEQMKVDALNTFPHECCGFLFGQEGRLRHVTDILEVNNISPEDHRRRFSISPIDYMNAENYADENGLSLLGIYHSHPNHPAVPSETDRLSAQPFFSYVILSIVNNHFSVLRSWRLNEEEQFEEEQVNSHIPSRIKIKQ